MIDDAVFIETRGSDRRHRGLGFTVDEGGEADRVVENGAPRHGLDVAGIAGVYVVDEPADGKGVHVLAIFTQGALAARLAHAKLDA